MITFDEVSFQYAGRDEESLRNVNLTIQRGESVVFCGRSGCGKTTLTRLVNGVIPAFFDGERQGEVRLDGMNVAEIPMYHLANRVGSVFQNPRTQFFNVDTNSEIVFGLENQGIPRDGLRSRLNQTIRDLSLEPLRNRSIFELSGGEKQKIAFASVYTMNPDVYVLDEPSSNLDMRSIFELRAQLELVKRQGKTILIAEHRLFYLTNLADRFIFLNQGKVEAIFTAEAFRALTPETRMRMGLRAARLRSEAGRGTASPDSSRTGELTLRINSLEVKVGKRVLLKSVSADIRRGEIIAICGDNGVGKTTFSRCLCGLITESGGEFLWEGRKMNAAERLKRAFLVMQDVNYELFAESVEKECTFGIQGARQEEVRDALSRLGLADFSDHHPNTLSGGQKQRLAVAVGMLSRKEILVFDEPTSGLDYDGMIRVAALLNEVAAAGNIIFVVTHDEELIDHACTRVLHIHDQTLT